MTSLVKQFTMPTIFGVLVLGLLVSINTTFGQSNSTGITLEKLIRDEDNRYKNEKDYLKKKMLSRKKK